MKKIRGEGFSIRFVKRPLPGKRIQDEAQDNIKPAPVEAAPMPEPDSVKSRAVTPAAPTLAETRLWIAARTGDCRTIRVLVMEGVDLEARDLQGRTAFNIATQYSQQNALKTLLAAREMRRMANMGDLPSTKFFRKFANKTGSDKV